MNGTIYDFPALPRLALEAVIPTAPTLAPARPWSPAARGHGLVGLVSNRRSHRNRSAALQVPHSADLLVETPTTRRELQTVLARFAERGIDLLVIDGGDGTIRDVLTCAGQVWDERWPAIAILPSGKTNALAVDLGVPRDWTLDDALGAASGGSLAYRAPIEVERLDESGTRVRGFLFGAGAFVDATALAQRTHRAGAFNGVAVGLALAWGVAQTLFGRADGRWRRGNRIALGFGGGARRMHGAVLAADDRRYLMVASTLQRLPAGLKPFGRVRPGLKTLIVDAPPRRMASAVWPILNGSEDAQLDADGYHRIDADRIDVVLDASFVLDGEVFPPGAYALRRTAPLRFVVP